MGRTEDWAWLCEDGEEPEDIYTPPVNKVLRFLLFFGIGIVLAGILLLVAWIVTGWAVSA